MININLNGQETLLIFNNRVFKQLADTGMMDVMQDVNIDKINSPEFIEKVGYYAYLQGCKDKGITPIDSEKFGLLLSFENAIEISNAFAEELIKAFDRISSKKKTV